MSKAGTIVAMLSSREPSEQQALADAWVAARSRLDEAAEQESAAWAALQECRAKGADGLTARMRQVLALLTQHKSDKEIAVALHFSIRTAKHHVSRLLAYYKVTSRYDLPPLRI